MNGINTRARPPGLHPAGQRHELVCLRIGPSYSAELVRRGGLDGPTYIYLRGGEYLGGGETIWALRQHHDWQREDFAAGYYSPEADPAIAGSKTLVPTHANHMQPNVADTMFEDDRLIEVSWEGEIVWE